MKAGCVSSIKFSAILIVILLTLFTTVQPAFAKPPAPRPTRTPKPTQTSIVSPTSTPTPLPTFTATPTSTLTPSSTPTFTNTPAPTFTPTATLPSATVPKSMAALGDSITGAYDTGGWGYHREYSWSTGTDPTVNSIYLRFKAIDPSINLPTNLAVSGTMMIDLNGQAASVNANTEFITILMGANDVCTSSQTTMTDVAIFRSHFDTALATLTSKAPTAKIYVLSIPNIYNLWSVLKNNSAARSTWALFNICQSMLANPLSTTDSDNARRAAVQQRNIDFNTQLQQGCATYAQCYFDNNAVYQTDFAASDVSTIDYFHPSISGQAKLALTAWGAWGLPYR